MELSLNKKVILVSLFFLNTILAMDAPLEKIEKKKSVDADTITLVSKEGNEFVLPIEFAKQSQILKNIIEDLKDAHEPLKVPLAFSSKQLEEITTLLASLYHHFHLSGKALLDQLEQETKISDPFALLELTNYLDTNPLITLASRSIAKELATAGKDISEKTFEKITQKIKERKLLENIFHQYYLLTGNKASGLPESIYTLTQQEQRDYPSQNWITPSFPTKALALMAGATLASALIKPKKELPQQGHLGVETISLITQGQEFHVPLEVALESSVIKNQYQNSLQHSFNLTGMGISSETLELIADIMWAIENVKHLKYRNLLDALARQVSATKQNVEELLGGAVMLRFKPALLLAAYVGDNNTLSYKFKTMQNVLSLGKSLSDKENQSKVKQRLKDLGYYDLAGYYYLFHGKGLSGIDPKDYGLSIQDYLNYSPEDLTYPIIERSSGSSTVISQSSQSISVSSDLGGSRIYYKNSLNLRNLQLNSLEGLSNIPGIENIRYLDLSHNSLSNLESNHFLKMKRLTQLDLSHNNIEVVEDINTFNGPLNLEVLDLSDNPIIKFNTAILSKLTKLKTLGWPGKSKYDSYKRMDRSIKERLKQRRSRL